MQIKVLGFFVGVILKFDTSAMCDTHSGTTETEWVFCAMAMSDIMLYYYTDDVSNRKGTELCVRHQGHAHSTCVGSTKSLLHRLLLM